MRRALASLLAVLLTVPCLVHAQDRSKTLSDVSTALVFVPFTADLALPLFGIKADRDYVDILITMGGAMVTDIAVCEALKCIIPEDRPDLSGSDSFPSGHTSKAFTAAEVVRMEYGWGWGAGAYAAAATTGILRAASDKHYWWDCAAGAVVGVASAHVGDLMQPTFRRWWNKVFGVPADISMSPTVDPVSGTPAAYFSIRF